MSCFKVWTHTLLALLVLASGLAPSAARAQGIPSLGGDVDIFSIHVVVGPSERDLDAVAVWIKQCEEPNRPKACGTLMRVLNKDLRLTGLFKLVDSSAFIVDKKTETFDETNYEAWFDSGARYLVKGEIVEGKVRLKLHNVLEKGSFSFKHDAFRATKAGTIKGVHVFMNDLVLALTGKKGLFDSRIWFVNRKGNEKTIESVFMDGYGRYTMIKNGSTNLFPSPGPGGKVLYTSLKTGLWQIFLGDERLSIDERAYRGGQFSPNKKILAVAANVPGEGMRGSQSDIFRMDPKTGELGENLTNTTDADEVTPSWSPGGNQMAFVSNRSGNPHIYVMNPDGSGQRRLTYAGIYNSTPDWGPAGLIVFTGLDEGQSDIFTVDLGGNLRRLTQDQGKNKDPRWSPGGQYIVFASQRSGEWNLYIMTPDGRYQWPILSKYGDYSTPWW